MKPFFAPSSDRANPQCCAPRCVLGANTSQRQQWPPFVIALRLRWFLIQGRVQFDISPRVVCTPIWNTFRRLVTGTRTYNLGVGFCKMKSSWAGFLGRSGWRVRVLGITMLMQTTDDAVGGLFSTATSASRVDPSPGDAQRRHARRAVLSCGCT